MAEGGIAGETGIMLTRTETSRSLKEAEKYKALEVLTKLGLLMPVSQMEVYHGRVGKKGEQWKVDPMFTKNGNPANNRNVYVRPALYASDRETAKAFALSRASEKIPPSYKAIALETIQNYTPAERQSWLDRVNHEAAERVRDIGGKPAVYTPSDLNKPGFIHNEIRYLAHRAFRDSMNSISQIGTDLRMELHEIAAIDTEARVIDLRFDINKLTPEDKLKYKHALEALAIAVTVGSPLNFEVREDLPKFTNAVNELQLIAQKKFILSREIAQIASHAGISEQTALQISSAFNSRQMALSKPQYLANRLLYNSSNIFNETGVIINGSREDLPINLEYAERYMREAHIVAAQQPVDSVTLDRTIQAVSFFDLDKIGTREQIDIQRHDMLQKMRGLIDVFPQLPNLEDAGAASPLIVALQDAHVKPHQLLDTAKQIGEFKKIYESDAGNWERFTLEEHTETVLRNFDENFADIIPVEYLVPLRLAILVHDLGKPLAVSRGEKQNQKSYNAFYAKDFLRSIGIDSRMQELISAIITDGADLAFKLQTQPQNENTRLAMEIYAEDVLKRYLGTNMISSSQVQAFSQMCKILQLCDGGAYTDMAITRRPTKGSFRNAPSFNKSFAPPIGLGRRDIKYPEAQ